jgi:hypothetical protein
MAQLRPILTLAAVDHIIDRSQGVLFVIQMTVLHRYTTYGTQGFVLDYHTQVLTEAEEQLSARNSSRPNRSLHPVVSSSYGHASPAPSYKLPIRAVISSYT